MIATGTRLVVPLWLRRVAARVWASKRGRIAVIATLVWHVVGVVVMVAAPMSSAAPSDGSASAGGTASLSGLMGWANNKDSHGINTANYYLSIDDGGVSHPIRAMSAWVTNMEFGVYRIGVGFAIWFIRQVLSFRWLHIIVAPVSDMGDALSVMTGRVNVVPVAFALAGVAMALWIFRARYTAAAYEGLMALVVAAAAVGFLAHPIASIAGDDGMIMKTKNVALEVAAGLANDGEVDGNPQANVDRLTSSMTDTFLRKPTQLINFGSVLDDRRDGGKCAAAFDKGYTSTPKKGALDKARDGVVGGLKKLSDTLGDAADATIPGQADPTASVRDSVAKCPGGDKLKNYADNPGLENMMTAGLMLPAAGLLFLFAIVLAGRVLLAAAWALFNGLKLIPIAPAAIAPMFRGMLMRSLADVAMTLCQVAFSVIYIAGYSVMINSIFGQSHRVFVETVLLVDIALVIAILLYWKGMGRLHKLSDKLAEIMARRPGVSPVSVSRRSQPPTAADVMARAHAARNTARGAVTVGKKVAKVGKLAGEVAGAVASGGTSTVAGVAARTAAKTAVPKWGTVAAKAASAATSTAADVAGQVVGTTARKATVDTGDMPDRESQQHAGMRAAMSAAALRDALSVIDPAAEHASSTPLRPGGGSPPTARRHSPTARDTTTSDDRTLTEQVYATADSGSIHTRGGGGATSVADPERTPAPAEAPPITHRRRSTPTPEPAPSLSDGARAARRASSGPVPASVGSTHIGSQQ